MDEFFVTSSKYGDIPMTPFKYVSLILRGLDEDSSANLLKNLYQAAGNFRFFYKSYNQHVRLCKNILDAGNDIVRQREVLNDFLAAFNFDTRCT